MNKKERIRAFELNDMAGNIRPLSGVGTKTVTTIEIGKSWGLHEPLFRMLSTALYANSGLAGKEQDEDSRIFYSDMYEKAVEEFYEYLGETFQGEASKRPEIDW